MTHNLIEIGRNLSQRQVASRVLELFRTNEYIGFSQDYIVSKQGNGRYSINVTPRYSPLLPDEDFADFSPIGGFEKLLSGDIKFRRDNQGKIFMFKSSSQPLQLNLPLPNQMEQE